MSTRSRSTWKIRADGQFDSRVGWKLNQQGKRVQHRFRVGSELKEAKRRDLLLRQVWERIEELQPDNALWGRDTLELAKQIAKGGSVIIIERAEGEDDVQYATRVHRLSRAFLMVTVSPEPDYGAAFGVRVLSALERLYEAPPNHDQQLAQQSSLFLELIQNPQLAADGPTLHQGIAAYEVWLRKEYAHPVEEITNWGRVQIKQLDSLRHHHRNLPLSQIGRRQVEEMFQYWRQRPIRKGTRDRRVSVDSAKNLLKALKRFLRWLHTCEDFDWRKPEDMHAISTKIVKLDNETGSKQITAEDLFTLDDLTLLYRYGQPLDRVLILLGLNCGFSVAESSTLLIDEIHLRSAHPARFQEFLDFESTNEHSFIKRHRRKNSIYGEFLLWDHTVRGIQWALDRRRKQPDFAPNARLLLNGDGKPYDRLTQGGNPCRQISNMFARLKKRIQDDGQTISDLPFKCFRKTGGDLVKTISGGETMAVFHCRGEVKEAKDNLADAYSTRKFGKVFRALQQVEVKLAPMFAAAGEEPFENQPQAYTTKSTIDRILKLYREGVLPASIAEEVGMSPSAVQRHITRVTGPRRPGPRKKTR